ncbi:hypothetical protein [Bradyrhizobium sp. 62]|uniref:hypothetical protein n=1 Tax=Bradyrhizobium sp. 62 TaxID=1043588 RepID=UPI001FF88694|nr:hypothetical protein [Bradyrhizobium sp. 62]MCK1368255.1 hypothetical protein [Bradyrhizobium sp. 62]
MEDDYYFVWVLDHSGNACPQIWAGNQFDRSDWQLNRVISKRLLNAAERTLSLGHLATLYPAP